MDLADKKQKEKIDAEEDNYANDNAGGFNDFRSRIVTNVMKNLKTERNRHVFTAQGLY